MIRGIGFDLIEIERIRRAWARTPRFAERILTPAEREYCLQGQVSVERLAGRWAGKEAVMKALGRPCRWHEIELLPDEQGCPRVRVSGRAALYAQGGQLMVSLTHTSQLAAAIAIWITE